MNYNVALSLGAPRILNSRDVALHNNNVVYSCLLSVKTCYALNGGKLTRKGVDASNF
jgi:hypothetical protein